MNDETTQEIHRRLTEIYERQKAIAKSVADIALGLSHEARLSRDRHSELQGLILGMLSDARRLPERRRRDSEDTKKFPLPGGEEGDAVQLTKRTQRKIVRWAVWALVVVLLNVAQFLLHSYGIIHTGGH